MKIPTFCIMTILLTLMMMSNTIQPVTGEVSSIITDAIALGFVGIFVLFNGWDDLFDLFTYWRRQLVAEEDETWQLAKEHCRHVEYELQLLVEQSTGHLLVMATPTTTTTTTTTTAVDDKEDVCFSILIHSFRHEDMDNELIAMVHNIPNDLDDTFWTTMASQDLDVTMTFDTIVNGLETVKLDTMKETYTNADIPMNCGTYLLELGKYWNIPITADVIEFILTNLNGSKYMAAIDDNPHTYLKLFDETTHLRQLNSSINSDRIVRKLMENMLEQHEYPKQLVRM